ncbi:hypothetical protein MSG28_013595 [Choristoneura fumiferana]|uniref:Uncharacterized protein n=1 Tax=Choristoneura fumiferana TaxID=7141 RepID=A0ACC0K896_CHOFU|nr:hypothetical protein MSG28_013595 [Choristoneura fumiferana]
MRPPFRTCRDTGTCDKEAHISGWPLTRARAVAARTRLRTMPFKVVQTFEDGDLFITFCPDHWESNGKLLWPQSLFEGEKLKKKEDSQPQNDWQVLDCTQTKKKSTINETPSSKTVPLKTALQTLSEARHTGVLHDTQTTSYIPSQHQVATDENTPAASTSSGTQGALGENMETYLVIPNSNQADTPIIYIDKATNSSKENCQLNYDLKSIENDINIIKRDIKSINDDNKTILEILNTILNNQAVIHNAVEPIERKVTELQVANEEFIAKSIKEKRNHALGLQPIKDTKDIEELEKKLLDSNYREDLQRKLSVHKIPGRNDKILAIVPLRSASSDGGENSESDKDELQSSDSGSSSPAPSISSSLMNLSIDSLHDDAGVNLCDNDKITNKFCNHPLDNITSAGGIESEKNAVNENVSVGNITKPAGDQGGETQRGEADALDITLLLFAVRC